MTSQDTSRNTSHRAGIVKLMQKIAHLCSKERPMHGFVSFAKKHPRFRHSHTLTFSQGKDVWARFSIH